MEYGQTQLASSEEDFVENAVDRAEPPTVYVDNFAQHANGAQIFKKAVTARLVEEALLDLFTRGKLHGTVHTCIGQELTGAVITEFLQPGDTVFSNHRCHGHFLSRYDDIEGLIAEVMGRRSGVCGGLGGSQHLYKEGFFSNGIQGGIVPIATGLAFAHKLSCTRHISIVFIGDGTLGEGAVFEALNIAAKWQLPLLVVLEDNGYSQSTCQGETLAGNICARAAAFGIETAIADTWDWHRLYDIADDMIKGMRADSLPRFLQVRTARLKAHSKGDDSRARHLVEALEQRDPLNLHLRDLSETDAAIVTSLRSRIRAAELAADQAPRAELLEHAKADDLPIVWTVAKRADKQRFVVCLNAALRRIMHHHDRLVMIGEDIRSPYGGAFKATTGLSDDFPDRVYNTPISEAAIVGIGAGLGLAGFYPCVEIMFGDFIGLAFDQIVNHAAKFHQMYKGQVNCNLIVRTPMGGGRGYGPTHSQTLDRHFLGVPGLRVVALNGLTEPASTYDALIDLQSGPTLVIENKLLYGSYAPFEIPAGFELIQSNERFPSSWIRPAAEVCDITLLGYGGTAGLLIEAADALFDKHDLIAQVLIIGQIYPFSLRPCSDVLGRADRMLVVEEGQAFAGFGAEVLGQLAEIDELKTVLGRRFAPPAHCIPSSGTLEKEILPNTAKIVDIVTAWCAR